MSFWTTSTARRQGPVRVSLAVVVVLSGLVGGVVLAGEPAPVEPPPREQSAEQANGGTAEPGDEKPTVNTIVAPVRNMALRPVPRLARKKLPKSTLAAEELEKAQVELEALVQGHVQHVNDGDVAAYMGDFRADHPQREVIKAYAERVRSENKPHIELEEVEVEHVDRQTARVRTVQRASYASHARTRVDAAEVIYRARRQPTGWCIESTSRKRVDDEDRDEQGPSEDDARDEQED